MTFKKVLSFFLTGATALSMTTAALAADDTPIMLPADVASQDWYAPAVRYVMEYDLMDVGRPDDGTTVFEPLRTVSRQEVADAICRAAGRRIPIVAGLDTTLQPIPVYPTPEGAAALDR